VAMLVVGVLAFSLLASSVALAVTGSRRSAP
jgi:hypothetical protein